MNIRLFSDNTPKTDGIRADVTLDIELETADQNEVEWEIRELLSLAFQSETYDADVLANDVVNEILEDYILVRR